MLNRLPSDVVLLLLAIAAVALVLGATLALHGLVGPASDDARSALAPSALVVHDEVAAP